MNAIRSLRDHMLIPFCVNCKTKTSALSRSLCHFTRPLLVHTYNIHFVSLSSFHPYFILIGWFQHFASATHFMLRNHSTRVFLPLYALHRRSLIQTHFVMFGFDQSMTPKTTKTHARIFFVLNHCFFPLLFVFILQKNGGKNVCWTKRLFSKNWFMLTIASTQNTVCSAFCQCVCVCFVYMWHCSDAKMLQYASISL